MASSVEAGTQFNANKAFDGSTDKASRWASGISNGPHWIYVDLNELRDIRTIVLKWETRKATQYQLQYATKLPEKESAWKDAKVFTERPDSLDQKIILDNSVEARYVRLLINQFDAKDPDSQISWNNISLKEMEIYGGIPKPSIEELLNQIQVAPVQSDAQKLQVTIPDSEEYDIKFNGADYEQLVDDDYSIYKPITDQTVTLSFKAINKENPLDYKFKEIPVVIPGKYTQENNDNEAPLVLPQLLEWKGYQGQFKFSATSKIIIKDDRLEPMANAFQKDLKEITGIDCKIEHAQSGNSGDFVFSMVEQNENLGLKKEGYLLDIQDQVLVKAEDPTGAYWSTRTILQIFKNNGNQTLPKGITRDYPMYEVRGFILDVGRKTFTIDYLKQMTKQLSWYKMNDFQIHLNDNLIPLENYSQKGEDPMKAYSGFRLESDIKKGGNNGLNQADLTSKDVFYTKEDFKQLIQDARVQGVNIVPEIDTPAHSLALTKVRPDLRHGTWGRQNDHLNLTTKYDESLSFVQDIFGEYMNGNSPVFDKDTVVHIGADEYTADGNAYRKFCNDMIDYVQKSGRKPRIWGSLTSIKGNVEVTSKNVEMQLWNYGWANMDKMYEKGFDLINCNDGNYYIVPNAGYYYDYLNTDTMYNLPINSIGGNRIPAGDKQMKGGAFAVWNDMTDYLNNGITEYDVYDRVQSSMPMFAAKLWGKDSQALSLSQAKSLANQMGDAPGTNFSYHVATEDGLYEKIDNERDVDGQNASQVEVDYKKAIQLNGGTSYVSTQLDKTVGLNNSLRFKVKRTSENTDTDQILFESDYGSIKGVQKGSGKFAISRENFDVIFDYTLPLNEWVEIEIKNISEGSNQNYVELYANGTLISRMGDDERTSEGKRLIATSMIPFSRIGSKTDAFVGYVDDVILATNKTYASTGVLAHELITLHHIVDENSLDETAFENLNTLISEGEELVSQTEPDQATINDLLNRIQQALQNTEYKQADYSQVDAILAQIPSADLKKIYTEDSIRQLENVKASIRRNLPKGMQDVVDSYAEQLQEALKNLEFLPVNDLSFYQGNITGTASSQETANEKTGAGNALDKNENTFWHTQWSGASKPHWYLMELESQEKVDGLNYLPRSGGGNGTATRYSVEVSTDGQQFAKVKEGTLAANGDEKEIRFEAANAKFVRFNILDSVGGFGSAAEFKVHYVPTSIDIPGLQALIDQTENLDRNLYTEDSLANLDDVLQAAKEAVNKQDVSINEVQDAKMALYNALTSQLKAIKKEDTVDTDSLKAEIQKAEELQEDSFTTESWQKFVSVLQNVKALLEKENLTQMEVNKGTDALKIAIEQLEKRPDVQKEALEQLISTAKQKKESDYTPDSWQSLQDAMQKAKAVFDDPEANQEKVDQTLAELNAAIDSLQEAFSIDPSKLETLLEATKSLQEENYTSSSWKRLQDVIDRANALLEKTDKTQEEIDQMVDEIRSSYQSLVKKADTSKLQSLIDEINKIDESLYTPESLASLKESVKEAKTLLDNEEVSQEDIDAILKKLETAKEALVQNPEAVDKTDIKALVDEVKKLEESLYTPESYASLKEAMQQAETVIAKEDALQEEVDMAYSKLNESKENLIKNPKVVDRTSLEDILQQAKSKDENQYTPNSYDPLKDAIEKATMIVQKEDVKQEEINQMVKNLQSVLEQLVTRANKEKLVDAMYAAAQLLQNEYTPESYAALQNQLLASQEVLANENASQIEVDQAVTALQASLDALVKQMETIDANSLKDLINEIEGLSKESYTPETWDTLMKSLDNAKVVLSNPDATQEMVDQALEILKTSQNNLEKIETNNTNTSLEPSETKDTTSAKASSKNGSTHTGTFMNRTGLIASLATASGCIVILIKKLRDLSKRK